MIGRLTLCVWLGLWGQTVAAAAEELLFPAPVVQVGFVEHPGGALRIATGAWTEANGTPQRSIDGRVTQRAYRLEGTALSTRDLMMPLQDQLLADGFDLVFACETSACGGFDFRYDLPILPEPTMHVDLGDFHYFAGIKRLAPGGEEAVMLIVSRSANAGFVQVSQAHGMPAAIATEAPVASLDVASTPADVAERVTPAPIAVAGDMAAKLETGGAFALDDLVFASGAGDLAPGDYASLVELSGYLSANPQRQIALVGHTDASGGLEANVVLSRRRAESVRQVLIAQYGVNAAQVVAEGVGFLAPRASNLTDTGRATNRRVEVMLTNTQ